MSKRKGDPGYAGGWCIHFRNASRHDTCEAGVAYDSFPQPRFATQPCFLTKTGESKPGAAACPSLRRPTPEEIAAHEVWVEARFGLLTKVMTGIRPWREAHKGKSAAEIVECPACKGRLRLSISAYNGHVHGHCETEGCVSWME